MESELDKVDELHRGGDWRQAVADNLQLAARFGLKPPPEAPGAARK